MANCSTIGIKIGRSEHQSPWELSPNATRAANMCLGGKYRNLDIKTD